MRVIRLSSGVARGGVFHFFGYCLYLALPNWARRQGWSGAGLRDLGLGGGGGVSVLHSG